MMWDHCELLFFHHCTPGLVILKVDIPPGELCASISKWLMEVVSAKELSRASLIFQY